MARVKADITLIKELTQIDKEVLLTIYYHRCLNEKLLDQYFYKNLDITADRIQWLEQNKLIESVMYNTDLLAFFLTTQGIETIKFIYDMPAEEWDFQTKKIKKLLKNASDLKMNPKNIKHQMALNNFVLEFKQKINKQVGYQYYDEKFMNVYRHVQPDGLIQLNCYDIFLEIDMTTERSSHLQEKWNKYRTFLNSFECQDKKIIVFFVLNQVKRVANRRNTVLASINNSILDKLDTEFEIYIDTPEQLLSLLFDRLLPNSNVYLDYVKSIKQMIFNQHEFSYSDCTFLQSFLPGTQYYGYIRKLNKFNKIEVEYGKPQEFLMDFYWKAPLSILKKITYFNQSQAKVKEILGRDIPYLIIVDNEKQFYNDLSVIESTIVNNIYFTTLKRLETMPFYKALYQYDAFGYEIPFFKL